MAKPTRKLNLQYFKLFDTLMEAYDQAAEGKGKHRHEDPVPFEQQDIVREALYCGLAGPICQIRKKAKESLRLDLDAARRELLGCIVYAAGAIAAIDIKRKGE